MSIVIDNRCIIRDEITALQDEISKLKTKKNDAYHLLLYKLYNKDRDIKYGDMDDVGYDEDFELPTLLDGTIFSKRVKSEVLEFNVLFSERSTLTRHRHSDCEEHVKVTNDAVFKVILGSEKKNNLKVIYMTNEDELIIPKNMPHQFTNCSEIEGKFNIKFIK